MSTWSVLPQSTTDVAVLGWGDGMIEATATRDGEISFAGAFFKGAVDYSVTTPAVIEATLDELQAHLVAYWRDDPLRAWGINP